jgi:DNA (cytosine-5)-methyltransferase 1
MTAYYNEFDKNAAQWLRELIKDGQIAPGVVDERSICDIRPDKLIGYEQIHLFAGIGIWSYALRQAGWPDSKPIWSASLPCQPFSCAGSQQGFDDDRHLWPVVYDLIKELRPSCIIGEQSASPKALAWWDVVSNDLEATDYATAAVDMAGGCVGAFHQRHRLWWVATSSVANSTSDRLIGNRPTGATQERLQAKPQPTGQLPDGSEGSSAVCAMGDTDGQLPASNISGSGNDRDGSTERLGTTEDRNSCPAIWANTHWLQCKDGKYRAADQDIYPLSGLVGMARKSIRCEVERGLAELFGSEIDPEIIKGIAKGIDATRNWGSTLTRARALANGSASSMVSSGLQSGEITKGIEDPQEFRAMLLKGAGNSIVAPLAVEFIRSVMEVIQ